VSDAVALYFRKQTALSLLRALVVVYFKNFFSMLAVLLIGAAVGSAVLAMLLLPILIGKPNVIMGVAAALVAFAVYYAVVFVVTAAMTVAISEVALGNRPSALRAYRRILAPDVIKRLLVAGSLQFAITLAGFCLLIVPGIVLFLRYALVPTVVALENIGGQSALKRSSELSRGHLLRIGKFFFVAWAAFMLVIVPGELASLAPHEFARSAVILVLELLLLLASPIVAVLIYYDLRVRKEGYDIGLLAEDLRD
jgi:hypothetical protein